MCGFVGFCDFTKKNTNIDKNIIIQMNNKLINRGPDEEGYFYNDFVNFGHKRLIVIDPNNGKQPMTFNYYSNEYTLIYNGQIYNCDELRKILSDNGFSFEGHSDTEILLKSYIHFGDDVVNHLNGIFAFAIWNNNKKELFIARDHFGVKPFFYTIFDNTFIFSSELKGIFEFPNIDKTIDTQGINELFGLGPAHTPGTTIFKNIYELKPASFGVYNESGLYIQKYWKLESKEHLDNFEDTCSNLKNLLQDSITKQLVSDVPLCTFLSGGLDSSIITKFASESYKVNGKPPLDTFSVDYIDNDKNFVKSDFQPNSDNYYINLVTHNLHSNHHKIVLDTPELFEYLEDAMTARDMPGMADIDSSLLLFCKNVKKEMTVALSGECADEIFGGYPWFFRKDALDSNTFPWSIALNERQNLLNPNISTKTNLKEYIDFRYIESLGEVELLESDSIETKEKRKISHLTMNWFMQTLLDRSDRMSMCNGLEIRVPFCDFRLAEYVWNIPWEWKALKGREKGLLRYICRDFLPSEIIDRKKSPYPKTHNPTYLKAVKDMLQKIMDNPSSPIHNLLNSKYIQEIIDTNGTSFVRPWFGQLMTGPQLMAYIIQVNMWLEKYNPKIELF